MKTSTKQVLDEKRRAFQSLQCSINDFGKGCVAYPEAQLDSVGSQVSEQMQPVRDFMDKLQAAPFIGLLIKSLST